MDIQERIVIIMELVTKNLNAGKKVLLATNNEFKQMANKTGAANQRMMALRTTTGKLAFGIRKATAGFRGFRMEALGVMFAGMALQRVVSGLFQPAMDAFGVMDLWQTMLLVFFIPAMELLFPYLLQLMDWFMSMPESTKLAIGIFLLIIGVLGTLMAIVGALVLGIGSFILMLPTILPILAGVAGLFLILIGVMEIVNGKWEGLGLVIMGIGVILLLFIGWWALIPIAIGACIYLVIKHWDKFEHFFIQLWNNIKLIALKAAIELVKFVTGPLKLLSYIPGMGFLADGIELVTGALQGLVEDVEFDIAAQQTKFNMEQMAKSTEDNMDAMKGKTVGTITDMNGFVNSGFTKMTNKTKIGMDNVNNKLDTGFSTSVDLTNTAVDEKNSAWNIGMAEQLSDTTTYVDKINSEISRIGKKSSSGGGGTNLPVFGQPNTYNPGTGIGYNSSGQGYSSMGPMKNDFIWRAGEGAVSISPNDNLVGTKNGTAGGGIVINQNITLSATNKDEFSRMIRDANAKLVTDITRLVGA